MKLSKQITTATMLLASVIGSSDANDKTANPFYEVTHFANSLKQLSQNEDNERGVFEQLEYLTISISNLNNLLSQKHFKLNKNRYNELITIRTLLDFVSSLVVSKYETVIFKNYFDTYRAYSNSVTRLDHSIYKVKEKLKLIDVLHIDDLQLNFQEINEITDATNRLYGIK